VKTEDRKKNELAGVLYLQSRTKMVFGTRARLAISEALACSKRFHGQRSPAETPIWSPKRRFIHFWKN
jgi:hypothetical protein